MLVDWAAELMWSWQDAGVPSTDAWDNIAALVDASNGHLVSSAATAASLAARSSWRSPSLHELQGLTESMLDCADSGPACATAAFWPDGTQVWSASEDSGDLSRAWTVTRNDVQGNLAFDVASAPKTSTYRVPVARSLIIGSNDILRIIIGSNDIL